MYTELEQLKHLINEDLLAVIEERDKLREACEAARKFASHFLDKPKDIYWSDLQNLLDEIEPALAETEE